MPRPSSSLKGGWVLVKPHSNAAQWGVARADETVEPDISIAGSGVASELKELRDSSTTTSPPRPSPRARVSSAEAPLKADGWGPSFSALGCTPPIKQYADDDADYPDADYFEYTTMSLAKYQAFKVELKATPMPYSALEEMSE